MGQIRGANSWGEPPVSAAWGDHLRPGLSPGGGNGKGGVQPHCCRRLFLRHWASNSALPRRPAKPMSHWKAGIRRKVGAEPDA